MCARDHASEPAGRRRGQQFIEARSQRTRRSPERGYPPDSAAEQSTSALLLTALLSALSGLVLLLLLARLLAAALLLAGLRGGLLSALLLARLLIALSLLRILIRIRHLSTSLVGCNLVQLTMRSSIASRDMK
jgi:hypothetical protein